MLCSGTYQLKFCTWLWLKTLKTTRQHCDCTFDRSCCWEKQIRRIFFQIKARSQFTLVFSHTKAFLETLYRCHRAQERSTSKTPSQLKAGLTQPNLIQLPPGSMWRFLRQQRFPYSHFFTLKACLVVIHTIKLLFAPFTKSRHSSLYMHVTVRSPSFYDLAFQTFLTLY